MDTYVGQIIMVAFNYAPEGFFLCQGQILNINQYNALYALLGNRYGGDGKTTFGLPNLTGVFPVGAGNNPYTLGNLQLGMGNATANNRAYSNQLVLTARQVPLTPHMHTAAFSNGSVTGNPTINFTVPAQTATGKLMANAGTGTTDKPGQSALPAQAPNLTGIGGPDNYIYGPSDGTTYMPVNVPVAAQPVSTAVNLSSASVQGTVTVNSTGQAAQAPIQLQNIVPYLTFNFAICYNGVWPPQPN